MSLQFSYSLYPLIALSSLMLTLPSTAYLLWLRPKSAASWNLIAFLVCINLSLLAMLALHTVLILFAPLWPLQDALLVVGSAFLVRLAYSLPTDRPARDREARLVSTAVMLLGLFTLGWVGVVGWRFWVTRGPLIISDAFWLLNPLATLIMTAVFLRRAVQLAGPDAGRWWQILRRPPNRAAAAQRNFAVATLSGLVQALGSVSKLLGISNLIPDAALIGIGTLLALALLLLAYLAAVQAENTLIVRHVGVALVVLLAIIGTIGIQVLNTVSEAARAAHVQAAGAVLAAQRQTPGAPYPPDVLYVAVYPDGNATPDSITLPFVNPALSAAEQRIIRSGIPKLIAYEPLGSQRVAGQPGNDVFADRWAEATRLTGQRHIGWQLLRDGEVTEFGFHHPSVSAIGHALVSRIMVQIVLGTLVVFAVLPVVYRRNLIVPLTALLRGVQQVNRGDLRVQVSPAGDDEIAYLTRSFNGMTDSLRELNDGLEQKVADRTHALEEARLQADSANRAKSVFLATMSHELRTPLNAILGYAQLLQHSAAPSTGEVHAAADSIERSGRHLLALTNDVLDLARVEAGRVTLAPQPVMLPDFVRRVGDLARGQAAEKGLTFDIAAALPADLRVLVDATRLRQVLLNLLGNAINYTERGGVTLSVAPVADAAAGHAAAGHARICFAVRDSGRGIAPAELPHIFEPYYRVAESARRSSGSGLGLPISRELVALMGGELLVESTPGVGSRFHFTLDLPLGAPQPAAPKLPAVPAARADRRHIFVVEDDDDGRAWLTSLLAQFGYRVSAFADGRAALTAALAEPPDIVLTDMMMPELDGAALLEALRAAPPTAGVRLLAMSASAFAADQARALAAGAAAFVPKPIDVAQLLPLLQPAADAAPAPAATRAELLALAQVGDVLGLRAAVNRLVAAHADPLFVGRLKALVDGYQMESLTAWLASQSQSQSQS